MLTDPTSDPDLPLLVAWLKKQPGSRQPRIVTLRQEGAPSTDMDLIQIDNVTQTATAHKKVSFFRMPQGGNIFADAGRTKAVIFDANNGLLLKVFGRYEFQSDNKVVVDHTPVQLTNKLFQLAWYLFGQVNQQLSREVLYESVWGNYGDPASRSLDTHVSMLRSQLHLFSGNEYVLEAIYGRGYSLKKSS